MRISDTKRNQRSDYDYDHPWPWQVKEHCEEVLADGHGPKTIAEIMGCHPSTVYRYLNRHGLQRGKE